MARTKEFDEDAALVKAMRLFWEQGYEKTSMTDLVERMGVHKRSMYDTFGDKHSLYMKTLKRYGDMIGQSVGRMIEGVGSAREAIRLLLRMAIRQEGEYPVGCLIVNTAVELALHDDECREWVHRSMTGSERLFRGIIEEGQQSGELDKDLDAEGLSLYFNNAFTGLRVMTKTEEDKDKLNRIIETTISILKAG